MINLGIGIGPSYGPLIVGGFALPETNLQARYDPGTRDSVFIDTSNKVSLVEDISGNSGVQGDNFMNVYGNGGAVVPNHAAYSFTGDFELIAKVQDYDSDHSGTRSIACMDTTSGQYRFRLILQTTTPRTLRFYYSTDGTAFPQVTSSSLTVDTNEIFWVKVTRVVSTGLIEMWESTDGVTWASVYSAVGADIGSDLATSTDEIKLGRSTLGWAWEGNIYQTTINEGIGGTPVLDVDYSAAKFGTQPFPESSVNAATVTLSASTRITHAGVSLGSWLHLEGVNGDKAEVANNAAFNFTGDSEMIAKIKTDDITANNAIISQRNTSGQYRWTMITTGSHIQAVFSINGTSFISGNSSNFTVDTDGIFWIKITRVESSGLVSYYESTDGESWLALGTSSLTSGALNTSTDALQIGQLYAASGYPFKGNIYRAIVNEGIDGTAVLDVDFEDLPYRSQTLTDSSATGADVTLDGGAVIDDSVDGGCLILPDTNSNGATIPYDAAFGGTLTEFEIIVDFMIVDSLQYQMFASHAGASGQYSWEVLTDSNGKIRTVVSKDGATDRQYPTSTVTLASAIPDLTRGQLKITYDGPSTDVIYYTRETSSDAWAQLGTTVSFATVDAIFDASSTGFYVGQAYDGSSPFGGNIYSLSFATSIGGTPVVDVDFTRQPKLVTSFVEAANGLVVTVNSTAIADAARISGARDQLQPVASAQMTYLGHTGENYSYSIASSTGGVTGPDHARYTGLNSIDLVTKINCPDLSSGAQYLIAKWGASGEWSFRCYLDSSSGIAFQLSTDGTTVSVAENSSVFLNTGTGVFDGVDVWVRIFYDYDNQTIDFYYKVTEAAGWTRLGSQRTAVGQEIAHDSTAVVSGGSQGGLNELTGRQYNAQIWSGDSTSGGTLLWDFDASAYVNGTTVPDQANPAEDVTIISGGCIVVQPSLWRDGTSDYMKTAQWDFQQPCCVYLTHTELIYASSDRLFAGVDGVVEAYTISATNIRMAAGATFDLTNGYASLTRSVLMAWFHSGASQARINKETAVTGSAGVNDPNGFTNGSGAAGIQESHGLVHEILLYDTAIHTTAEQNAVMDYLGQENSIDV